MGDWRRLETAPDADPILVTIRCSAAPCDELDETVAFRRVVAVALGFAGILLIARPAGAGLTYGVAQGIGLVSELARKRKLYMRDSAYIIAIDRVARACRDRHINFIGPWARNMAVMGNKSNAISTARPRLPSLFASWPSSAAVPRPAIWTSMRTWWRTWGWTAWPAWN